MAIVGRELTLRSAAEELTVAEMTRIVTDLFVGPAPDTRRLPRW